MLSTYLVARRDYLGYVTAWGFWLGLLFTPVLMGIFMFARMLAETTTPTRYYSVLETNGTEFADAMESQAERMVAAQLRMTIDPVASLQGQDTPALQAFDDARDAGASPEAALEAAGAPKVAIPRSDFVQIPPPAMTVEELRPYLTGQKLLDTPEGPQPLFGFINVPDEGPIEYWSDNLQSSDLMRLANTAEARLAEEKVFGAQGVSPALIKEAKDAARTVVQQRNAPAGQTASGESTAVTLADRAPFIVAIALAFVLWFLIFSVINYLLMGTIEERSNKIFDSLLTSVKLPNLLAGKLLAVLAVALTLMSFWGLGSVLVMTVGTAFLDVDPQVMEMVSTIASAALDPMLIIPALISFLLGYLMYGSLFLALGSLCDTIQEAQTLMTPLIVLLMAPLFMLTFAINDAQSGVISTMVWVPLFTPFLLILRMPTEPPLWEVLAQLGLMALAAFAILWLATKVYRAGAVHGSGVADIGRVFKGFFSRGKAKA